ncbi:MAG: hypothetical protein RSA56_04110, partial [Raoultibacter sp.]
AVFVFPFIDPFVPIFFTAYFLRARSKSFECKKYQRPIGQLYKRDIIVESQKNYRNCGNLKQMHHVHFDFDCCKTGKDIGQKTEIVSNLSIKRTRLTWAGLAR